MPGFSLIIANAMLDGQIPVSSFAMVHSANPGAAGTTAAVWGGLRKPITFPALGAGGSGIKTSSNGQVWSAGEVTGATTPAFLSIWSAVTAGNFIVSGALIANPQASGVAFTLSAGNVTIQLNLA